MYFVTEKTSASIYFACKHCNIAYLYVFLISTLRGNIRSRLGLPFTPVIITIHVDICRLVQLQGHLLPWPNLIIPIKTMFILSVITVIWQESYSLIVHSDTVFMLVSLWLHWLSG